MALFLLERGHSGIIPSRIVIPIRASRPVVGGERTPRCDRRSVPAFPWHPTHAFPTNRMPAKECSPCLSMKQRYS